MGTLCLVFFWFSQDTTLLSLLSSYYNNKRQLLQTQALRVGQEKKPCIGLTQENSIENSVQDCLPLYTNT